MGKTAKSSASKISTFVREIPREFKAGENEQLHCMLCFTPRPDFAAMVAEAFLSSDIPLEKVNIQKIRLVQFHGA